MKFSFRVSFAGIFILLLGFVLVQAAWAQSYYYRFTTPLPTVTCIVPEQTPNQLSVSLFQFHNEYNLPAGATLAITYIRNGVSFPQNAFSLPTGIGSDNASRWQGFSDTLDAPSLVGALQYDTFVDNSIVSRSTLHFTCNGAGTGTASITNEAPGTTQGAGGQGGQISDGRINPQPYAPVALYCDGSVLNAYAINSTGGTFAWSFNLSTPSNSGVLVDQGGAALSKTPDGRFSVFAAQADGKQYVFVFYGCPAPGVTETYLRDPVTGQMVRTE